jgi:nucleoid-associated protein YgaU
MSAATEFAPVVYIPERARTGEPPERLASVTTLYRPSGETLAPPLRLTHRGVVVVSTAVAVLAAALIGLAWLSAPSGASGPPAATAASDTVTVQSGDTLWSIATRVAPRRDPRAEVAALQEINHLDGAALVPGQVLRTH